MKTSRLKWLLPLIATVSALVAVGVTFLLPSKLSSTEQAYLEAARSSDRLLVEINSASKDLLESMKSEGPSPDEADFEAFHRKAQSLRKQLPRDNAKTARLLSESLAYISAGSRDLKRVTPTIDRSGLLATKSERASAPDGELSTELAEGESSLSQASELTGSARTNLRNATLLLGKALRRLLVAAQEQGDDAASQTIERLRNKPPATSVTLRELQVAELERAKTFLTLSARFEPPEPVIPDLVECPTSPSGPLVLLLQSASTLPCEEAEQVAGTVQPNCPSGWWDSPSGCVADGFQCVKTSDEYEGINVRCEAGPTRFFTFYIGG